MVNMEASSTPSFWQLSSVGCLITATAGLVRRGSLIHGNALSTSICTARNMQHPCMKTRPRSVAIRTPSGFIGTVQRKVCKNWSKFHVCMRWGLRGAER